MPSTSARTPRIRTANHLSRIAAIALPAAIAALLAGCGSSQTSSPAADPADAVPASAQLYAGAIVRPSGAQRTEALKAGSTLTHQADPYLALVSALQTPGSPPLSFASDIAPWLGPRAGIFITSLRSAGPLLTVLEQELLGSSTPASVFPFATGRADGAIVMDTSDAAKASSFLEVQAQRAGAHAISYRGVSYHATSSGIAFGLVGQFAVIGSESGLRSVIDTTLGGPALAHVASYSTLLAAAPPEALAHVYSSASAAGNTVASPHGGLAGAMGILAGSGDANISLVVSSGRLELDADSLASGTAAARSGLLGADPEGANALAELPGESWLAIGLGHLQTNIAQDVQALRVLASLPSALSGSGAQGQSASTINLKSLLEALITPLGYLGAPSAQARSDYASWMGSAGIFATGGSLLELKAAIVINSTDPALSHAAVAKLAAQLQAAGATLAPASVAGTDAAVGVRLNGLPIELVIADAHTAGGTKFVLGLGEASVAAALNPPNTLAGASSRAVAAAVLGDGIKPSLMVDFPTLLSLLEGLGLTEDPTISRFVPYLRSATTLSGGGRSLSADVQRFRFVLGLVRAQG